MEENLQPIGVGIIVFDQNGEKVLLGKRKNAYRAGMLGLPGGRIDTNETLEQCAKRELQEETGLQANYLEYVGVVREWQQDNTFNFIHFAFLCTTYTGTPEVVEPEKCESWEWYPFTNLPENILPGHKATLEMYITKSYIKDLV